MVCLGEGPRPLSVADAISICCWPFKLVQTPFLKSMAINDDDNNNVSDYCDGIVLLQASKGMGRRAQEYLSSTWVKGNTSKVLLKRQHSSQRRGGKGNRDEKSSRKRCPKF